MMRNEIAEELLRLNDYLHSCNLLISKDYHTLGLAAAMLKTAKWLYDEEHNMFYCSNCHAYINKDEWTRNFFCYHCGAEMKY